jgi:hypothetical protein
MCSHFPAPIINYIIFFLQLCLSFQSSSTNPFSLISPPILNNNNNSNYYYYYLQQLSFHSVAEVLTPVQTKQIQNIHKQTIKKQYKNTKHSNNKYTYYQNTHALQKPHIQTTTHYKTS